MLASPRMAALAVRLGSGQPVFMDATHGLLPYGYKLVSLVVIDEVNRVEPIGWAIVQHESGEVYAKVISTLKAAYERNANRREWSWQPSCFLTDNAQAEINGVRYVRWFIPRPRTHVLFAGIIDISIDNNYVVTPLTFVAHLPHSLFTIR